MGTQPISPTAGRSSRQLGSRLPLDYATSTGANFLTASAWSAATARVDAPEPHQMLSAQRLWADLLSSMPMCFNLFGDLANDADRATAALRAWWPDTPGTVSEVRFEHSPGRLDPLYLGNRSAFDAAFILDAGAGARGVVGVETKYHERTGPEKPPNKDRLARYQDITERSDVFRADALEALVGTDLQQIWLDHLLVLAMLQHPTAGWAWGRFVLVHPAGNLDFADACDRYSALLVDDSTFSSITLETLTEAAGALPPSTASAFRRRYLVTDVLPV